MESYKFILDLAIILLSTKICGLVSKRVHMPQVVGALLAGLLLGPAMLGVLTETDFIKELSELGVIVLMFCAGLETDIKEMKKCGKASMIIAVIGVIVPLVGGFLIADIFNRPGLMESNAICSHTLQNVFIGIILTATSVSITVETLKELGKLSTGAGNAILGAAVIDDILGIIALTIITSMADDSVKIGVVLIKILLFFVFAAVVAFVVYKWFMGWTRKYNKNLQRFVVISFVFCLVMAFCSEYFFGVADITGAYVAGMIISNSDKTKYISSRFETLSYLLLSPVFFASIGIQVELPKMSKTLVIFSLLLVVVAVITKIIGCGFGAKICGYSWKESLQVGVGMVSRGEVALIVAQKGAAVGLMSSSIFGPVVIVVIVTTILTPIMLKYVFTREKQC